MIFLYILKNYKKINVYFSLQFTLMKRLGDEGKVVIKRFLRGAITDSPIFTDKKRNRGFS